MSRDLTSSVRITGVSANDVLFPFRNMIVDLKSRGKLSILRRLLYGVLTALLMLAALEGILRFFGFEYYPSPPVILVDSSADRQMSRGEDMYRFHPYWFWELRPGARVERSPNEHVNASGYRGRDYPRDRTPGVPRIVALGDSSTFGYGVKWDEAYPAILERSLGKVEVLNFGVVGYSAFQGEKLFSGRVLSFQPDLTLVAFGAVDELLPAQGYDVDHKFQVTSKINPRVVLWEDRLGPLRICQLILRIFDSGHPAKEQEQNAAGNDRAWTEGQKDYVRNQSVASFERSLLAITQIARSVGSQVVFIIPPRRRSVEERWPWSLEYSQAIRKVGAEVEVPCLDASGEFRTFPQSDELLFLDDYHPNVRGHLIYGKFLASKLKTLWRR